MDFLKTSSENFSRWAKAVREMDIEGVLHLYSDEATFLPTFSSELKQGKDGARSYFEHFLKKAPVCNIIQAEVQPLNEKVYLQSGFYDFNLKDGSKALIRARFSFVWKKEEDGIWRIIHHHSSTLPSSTS